MAKNKVLTEKTDINTPFSEFVRKFKKQKTAMVAMVFLVFLVVLAFISYKIAPYGINEYDYSAIMQPPTAAHLFGTDEFGRDLFSRVICGTRISLSVGLFAVTVGMLVGTIMGLLAGYYGGIVDSIIMRICDVLLAFPGLILAIAIVAILGSGLYNVVIAVAVFNIPKFARLVRGNTLETKNSVFVQAARNIGAGDMRILFKHILPSAIPNIIVQYTMSIGTSIITASSLSFLGMGAQPPTPEWGLLLSNGRNYMLTSWHITLFPGLAIFFTVLDDDHNNYLEISAIHNEEGYREIRSKLSAQYNLSNLEPNIQVWNVDLRGDRSLTLRYVPHNRVPLDKGRREVLKHVHRLWGFDVLLEQQNADGSVELLERTPPRPNPL